MEVHYSVDPEHLHSDTSNSTAALSSDKVGPLDHTAASATSSLELQTGSSSSAPTTLEDGGRLTMDNVADIMRAYADETSKRTQADNEICAARAAVLAVDREKRRAAREGKTMISEVALVARIRRALARKDSPQRLNVHAHKSRMYGNYGRYTVDDVYTNTLVTWVPDIEQFGRDLGVLHPSEACEGWES
jgi:hypothetical protein